MRGFMFYVSNGLINERCKRIKMMFDMIPTMRMRPSPFYDATVKDGVTGFTHYNYMLMPSSYGDADITYNRLLNGVAMWDVAAERQVEIIGPDAAKLTQILAPRDLSNCKVGQGKYVAICNHAGTIINDPIVLKLDEDRFWLSIADSNMLFWARAIAAERGLRASIFEPDVSPLAVQGPQAENVVASLLGDWVRELKYFWFKPAEIENIPIIVARSGWSKQGGFELYLMDGSKGTQLWNLVREAGKQWDIGPGNPDSCERIESGLLSWGGDTDDTTNPFEVGMKPYVDLHVADDVVGIKALREIDMRGVVRHQLGVVLEGYEPTQPHRCWYPIMVNDEKIGDMTNGVFSRKLKRNIGFALVSCKHMAGDRVEVLKDGQKIVGQLTNLPF